MVELPEQVLPLILKRLPTIDLGGMMLVSRQIHDTLSSTTALWRNVSICWKIQDLRCEKSFGKLLKDLTTIWNLLKFFATSSERQPFES